jgi:type IV pilus assembly protein PilA
MAQGGANMYLKKSDGFTLIELMMVVAIIGILAAVALPSYQGYAARATYAEVMAAATPARTSVDICVQTRGPDACTGIESREGWSVSAQVASVAVSTDDGEFLVTVTPSGAHAGISEDDTYQLRGAVSEGTLLWSTDPSSGCIAAGLC